MIPLLAVFSDWALLVLRIAIGAIFIAHGWPKVRNLKQTSEGFNAMGFRPGIFWAPLVAVVELGGGIALLFGFLTQVVGGLLAGQFFVILIWKLFRKEKLVGGFELDLIIFGASLILLTIGGGMFSLDKFLHLRLF